MSFIELPYNDTWVRDFGPLGVYENGALTLLDFTFDGWGGKFEADKDNALSSRIHKNWLFGVTPLEKVDLVLEGGSLESDGRGTVLSTTKCLLNPNRNGGLSKEDVEGQLLAHLGVSRVLWLENGALEGDDTDAHIDTLARFVKEDTIAYVTCEDKSDSHYEGLLLMEKELQQFRTKEGEPYTLVPLPLPKAQYSVQGERLPATYANFLILNKTVLMPSYNNGDAHDKEAVEVLKAIYPEREIIPIPCLALIEQGGSLHCSTMQIMKDKEDI